MSSAQWLLGAVSTVSESPPGLRVRLSPLSFTQEYSSEVWTLQCGWVPHPRMAWSGVILVSTRMICGPYPHAFPLWPQGPSWSSSTRFHCCHSLTDLALRPKILQVHDSLGPELTSFPVSTNCKARYRVSVAPPPVAMNEVRSRSPLLLALFLPFSRPSLLHQLPLSVSLWDKPHPSSPPTLGLGYPLSFKAPGATTADRLWRSCLETFPAS